MDSAAAPTPATRVDDGPDATPLARRVAEQQGVDLAGIEPSGSGRITRDDVTLVVGATEHAAVDAESGRPRRMPKERRAEMLGLVPPV